VLFHFSATVYFHTHDNHPPADSQNHPHQQTAFPPWHRMFVVSFERDLQAADRALGRDGSITVPYWDWTHDNGPATGRQRSSFWGADFMGGNGSGSEMAVTTGPFRRPQAGDPAATQWRTVFGAVDFLQRDLGGAMRRRADPTRNPSETLPTSEARDRALAIRTYDREPWNRDPDTFRNRLEGWIPAEDGGPGLHNRVHVWVGGTMESVPTAPNDPVFFIHHCYVDKLWAQWQRRWPVARFPEARYPASRATFDRPLSEGPSPGTGRNDGMYPWDGRDGRSFPVVRPLDVLDHTNIRIGTEQWGYTFDDQASWRVSS
jgi:tyrosinase